MGLYKNKQVRLYLNERRAADFEKLVRSVGSLSEAAVASALLDAALAVCAEQGYKLPLPLKFEIVEPGQELNEGKGRYGKAR